MTSAPTIPPGSDPSALIRQFSEAVQAFRHQPPRPMVVRLPRSLYEAVARDPQLKHLAESGRVIPPGRFDE